MGICVVCKKNCDLKPPMIKIGVNSNRTIIYKDVLLCENCKKTENIYDIISHIK